MKKQVLIFIIVSLLLLTSCGTVKPNPTAKPTAAPTPTDAPATADPSPSASEGITDEALSDFMKKYDADDAVVDMLLPLKALLISEEEFVSIFSVGGIVKETIIPRTSVAKIEKTEIPGADMTTVKITDKTGADFQITLTPDDAAKVE